MKISRVITTVENEDLESVELLADVKYEIEGVVSGKTWGGGIGWLCVKDIYTKNGRHGQIEDFEDMLHSLHLAKTGDFVDGLFEQLTISWYFKGSLYRLDLSHEENMPEWAIDYFVDESIAGECFVSDFD